MKDARRFPSNYGGGDITPAQYIIELICAKKAAMSKTNLSYKFWYTTEWSSFFKRWLRQVHILLKKYDALAIINALNDEKSGKRWSIHTDFMLNLIDEHSKKLKKENKSKKVFMDEETEQRIKNSKPRPPQIKNALFEALNETEHLDMAITNG